jgi:hypothetical protein
MSYVRAVGRALFGGKNGGRPRAGAGAPADLDPGHYLSPEAYAFGLMRAAVPTDRARELIRIAVRRYEAQEAGESLESATIRQRSERRWAQAEANAIAGRALLRDVGYLDPEPDLYRTPLDPAMGARRAAALPAHDGPDLQGAAGMSLSLLAAFLGGAIIGFLAGFTLLLHGLRRKMSRLENLFASVTGEPRPG